MNFYFNINYEFDKQAIHQAIDVTEKGYICVADGVVMTNANRDKRYLDIVNASMFSICDSSWIPLYLKFIYDIKYEQYCGSDIFKDIVVSRKYRMLFLGTQQSTLNALQKELMLLNPDVKDMKFVELPFLSVEDFDYKGIAKLIDDDGAKIIWVALGAPKQEKFMNMLLPYISYGVMIGVGAVFKFYSGTNELRCPKWMQKYHLEFLYRIIQDPHKQLKRCFWIIVTLPKLYISEMRRKKRRNKQSN